MMRRAVPLLAAAFAAVLSRPAASSGQETLGSPADAYRRVLELWGEAESPVLTYRTRSDVEPRAAETGRASFQPYGPELFLSYNSAYPHGSNDGALWQGVGLNGTASAGFRAEAFGIAATVKPVLYWEENRDFDTLPSASSDEYGYFWRAGADLPQRPGDDPVYGFDWGDTELRWALGAATVGFGTQAAWIGPGRINAIVLSNNAPSFPKADIGLRKTETAIGAVEARLFWGRLTESEHFDDDRSNDHNSLLGLAAAYRPSFFRQLTVGFHRTMLGRWDEVDPIDPITLMVPAFSRKSGHDDRDQRASISASLLFPESLFECWIEWARNDYTGYFDKLLRYPFHSQGWTVGFRKGFDLTRFGGARGELLAETTVLESSRDYEFIGPYYFYGHGVITQGHTNGGQSLGSGTAGGGNAQYLAYTCYVPDGHLRVYAQRVNRDSDYAYFLHFGGTGADKREDEYRLSAEYTLGVEGSWLTRSRLRYGAGAAYCLILNPLREADGGSALTNLRATVSVAYECD